MDWVVVGLILSLITAVIIALGLRAQRRGPERKWPIIAVGLVAGLVAGLAIIQAIWLADRYPHRQKAIDRITVLIGGGLMMAMAYTWYGPPFGIGTEIESGYIERPLQGYAITLPLDWRVEDLSGVEMLFGEKLEPGVEPDIIAGNDERDQSLMIMTIDDDEAADPRAVAFGAAAGMRLEPGYSDVEYEAVDTEVGEMYRIDALLNATRDQPRTAPIKLSIYLSTQDQIAYQLLFFSSEDPPADRWLGIVESLEYLDFGAGGLLPVQITPEPTVPGGSDFDIDFPDHWQTEALEPDDWAYIGAPLDADDLRAIEVIFSVDHDATLSRCLVYDLSGVAQRAGPQVGPESVAAYLAQTYGLSSRFSDVTREVVELPAGPAGHVSAVDGASRFHDAWYFGAGDTWIALECRSPMDAAGVWRSFARSFEWQ